ncbi:MAG: NAD-binding protein [Anaerolineales bacterium]|nr:NAD-binding protein [Anaerolineales bacterium]
MISFALTIFLTMRALVKAMAKSGIAFLLVPILGLLAVGTLAYRWLEGWTVLEALYATVITITTVGYGDFTPQTVGGRIFAIFFTIAAIGLAGYSISALAAVVIEFEATKRQRLMEERRMTKIAALKDHTIICGSTTVGHRVANEFYRRKRPFILLEPNEAQLKQALLWLHEGYIRKRRLSYEHSAEVDYTEEEQKSVAELADEMGIVYLLEDPTDEQQLRRAGLARASGLVVAMADDRDNMSILLSARDIAPKVGNAGLRLLALVNETENMRRMYLAGAQKVVLPSAIGGFSIASHMLSPYLGEFWDHMLYEDDQLIRFMDMTLADNPGWVGKTADSLRAQGQMVVAIRRNGRYLYAPAPDTVLEADDVLITLGTARE